MPTAGTNITGITKSDIGVTVGPDWAANLNGSLDAVDDHDHTTGKGSKVTPAAMDINADVNVNGKNLNEIRTTAFNDITDDTTADIRVVYVKSGNLYYRNSTGQEVQITTGTSVNAGAGSISGMSGTNANANFNNTNDWFQFQHDSGLGYQAKVVGSDLLIYKFNDATNYVTLKYDLASAGSVLKLPAESGTLLSTNTNFAGGIALEVSGTSDIDLTVPTGRNVKVTIGTATAEFTDDGSGGMTLALS